jgi:hypothetical protein
MSASRVVRIAAVISLFLLSLPASFAEDWPPIAPEDLKMTSIAEQPGAPAVILFRQETDDDLNNAHTYYKRIKILTQAGLPYADVELPYNRRTFRIVAISGRTIHADGTIVKFSGRPLDKIVEKSHNVKERVKSFSLPDVQVGSIIDFRYTLSYDDHTLIPPNWDVQLDLFQKKASFQFFPYMEEWVEKESGRSGQGVAWTPYIPQGQPQPQLHHGIETTLSAHANRSNSDAVDLTLENIPALVKEPYMPPTDLLRWRVNFYYRTTSKSENFWKDEGKYWNKEVDSFLDHKAGIGAALQQIFATTDTPEIKVRKIYAYVSKLENRTFMPEKPEQEVASLGIRVNRSAEDVLQQRSGTHDDLNRLFVAMVRFAGIPAWMIRVPDRGEYVYQAQFLDTRQFDAELAIVQLDGKDVFLDPGTQFCPYGMLRWHYSGVDGQRQSPTKGTEIGTSTLPEYKQNMIQRKAVLSLQDDGSEEGTVTVGFFGLEGMDRRQEGALTDAAGKKKLLEDEIKKWLPGGSEVSLTQEPNWDNPALPMVAIFKVSGPLATSAGKRRIIPLHVFEVNESPRFPATERANPIYFYDPSCIIDEVHITIPLGTSVESLPPNDSVHLTYALYDSTQKMEQPTMISSTRTMIMAGLAFPKDNYKEVKSFYDKASASDGQQVLLKAAAHAEGN